MNVKIYLDNDQFIAGTTLKDTKCPEQNNMALHVCDDPKNIIENREALASYLHCGMNDFVCANQTHSANVHQVSVADKGRGAQNTSDAIANTDALYTFESQTLLSTFTADCVPVIFYNEIDGLTGVIHSGWQGTVKEISLKVFQQIINNKQSDPKNIKVILGPALSQEKFEVDTDVYEKFAALGYANDYIYFNKESNKYHIDNQQAVKKQCELAGIPSENILIDRTCTFKSEVGFSYRQDKKAGRHLSFIMRKN